MLFQIIFQRYLNLFCRFRCYDSPSCVPF